MINYYYYIEVKHTESIFSPVSKVIIKPENVPNMKYIPEEQQEKTFAAYAYDIWTAYRNNKQGNLFPCQSFVNRETVKDIQI